MLHPFRGRRTQPVRLVPNGEGARHVAFFLPMCESGTAQAKENPPMKPLLWRIAGRGPLQRYCAGREFSECGSADLHELDWSNWFQDDGYIHVRRYRPDEGETWHRVWPKRIRGRIYKRIAVVAGQPCWLFDKAKRPPR